MLVKSFAVSYFLSFALISSQVVNYCERNLCKQTEYQHITCSATGDLLQTCPSDARAVPLSDDNIKQILDLHNQYRNKLAGGEQSGFDSATRMTTMVYNEELADYAGLNVRRCKFEHDCHNTPQYKYSGQNIFFQRSIGGGAEFKEISAFIEESIRVFWDENKLTNMDAINNCCGQEVNGKEITHFLQMATAQANEVGCAISQYSVENGKESYIACNYSFGIPLNFRLYKSGEPTSDCQTGPNPDYPSLCSTREPVDPNDLSQSY